MICMEASAQLSLESQSHIDLAPEHESSGHGNLWSAHVQVFNSVKSTVADSCRK